MAKYRSRRKKAAGKRIVYVTPYYEAAKEIALKHEKHGNLTMIEREYDDTGRPMYVVYAL